MPTKVKVKKAKLDRKTIMQKASRGTLSMDQRLCNCGTVHDATELAFKSVDHILNNGHDCIVWHLTILNLTVQALMNAITLGEMKNHGLKMKKAQKEAHRIADLGSTTAAIITINNADEMRRRVEALFEEKKKETKH